MSLLRGLLRRGLDLPAAVGPVERFLEWIPAADGTRLATAVFRPKGPSRSLVVTRTDATIHAKRQPAGLLARLIAEQGHTVVVQECRGLGASEGDFEPFVAEARDGASLIDWARCQTGEDLPLSLLGFGYGAYAAWAAHAATPHPVASLIAAFGARDPYAWTHTGGALRLETSLSLALGWDSASNHESQEFDLPRALKHRPLIDADRVGSRRIDWWRPWLTESPESSFWNSRTPALPETPPATLLIGGWRNSALPQQLEDYRRLTQAAAAASTPRPEVLIGPWGDVPLERGERRVQLRLLREVAAAILRFVELPAGNAPARRTQPVTAFISGSKSWRNEVTWPPKAAAPRTFALGGDAPAGQGVLSEPTSDAPDATDLFVYDPADAPHGDSRARVISDASRGDVLRYSTPLLPSGLEIAGNPSVHLFVASQVARTDFVARLYEVDVKERVTWLSDGIVRDASLDVEIEIELTALWHRIAAGSCLRLEIASACFPRFDRHPNTEDAPSATRHGDGVPALQALHHGSKRPSRLVLPVVSGPA